MSAIEEVIHTAFFTPTQRGWGLPLLFWGMPGVGKTSIIESVSRDCGLLLKVLSPGEQGEGAFGVIPMPITTKSGVIKIAYPAPDWIDMFEDCEERGVVFIDELTTAPPALQPALLGLIQAGRIGSATLPRGVRILGAANPPECAAGGWDISPPIANRLGHVSWPTPDSDEWSAWLLRAATFMNEAARAPQTTLAEENRVLDAWDMEFAKAKGVIAAFVRARPDLLFGMPKAGDAEVSRAWCSPRSWENAVRALTAAAVHNVSIEAKSLLVNAFIGQGASLELTHFMSTLDLPDPEKLLDGVEQWKPNPARIDQTFAVLTSCSATLLASGAVKQNSRAEVMWDLFGQVGAIAPDIVWLSIKPIVEQKIGLSTKNAVRVLGSLRPVLQAAGLSV